MKKLLVTIEIEWIKTKGLGLFYLAICMGMIAPLLQFVFGFMDTDHINNEKLKYSVFEFFILGYLKGFIHFFLLLYIVVSSSRIAQTDHKNGGWLLMETQPTSKFNIYFAKYINLLVLSFFCVFFYFLFSILFAWIDYYLHPNLFKNLRFDTIWILETYSKICLTILGVAALQLFVSVIFSGFIWPFLIGILGLFVNVYSLKERESFSFIPYNNLYVFTKEMNIKNLNNVISFAEYLSIFWMFIFFVIGFFWYSRKGFKNAFLKDKKNILSSFAFVLVCGIGFYFLQKPIPYRANGNKTFIEGYLETDLKVDSVKIFTKEFHKKIGAVPVKNGKFVWETRNLPLDEYILEFGGKKLNLIFGKGDWFRLHLIFNKTDMENYLKSNRKAEQEYTEKASFGYEFYSIIEIKNYNVEPQEFYSVAQSDWKKNLQKLNRYTTAENYGLSEQYKTYKKQLMAIEYLNQFDNYRKIHSPSDPKFLPPKDFSNELKFYIAKPSPLLSKDDNYIEYKLSQMLNDKEKMTDNPDSLLFIKINALPNGIEKDRLLSKHLIKNMELKTDSVSRNGLYALEINQIKNKNYKKLLSDKLHQLNISQKGADFTDLVLIDDKGKRQKLSQYRGKYIIIDFWASWCGPCKTIRPIFDRRRNDYKYYNNLQFISISLDENKEKWMNYLKTSPSKIPQYWLPTAKEFGHKYNLNYIPRFIIINPEGKIYNFNAPLPDEDNFVEILDELKRMH